MRKFVGSAVAVLALVAFASAEEFTGIITKFEDGKITVKKFNKEDKKLEDATTLKVSDKVKIQKGKFSTDGGFKIEADGDYEGGKDALVKAIKEAADKAKDAGDKGKKGFGFGGGVFAQVTTEGSGDNAKVTEIRVMPAFGKKKKDAQ